MNPNYGIDGAELYPDSYTAPLIIFAVIMLIFVIPLFKYVYEMAKRNGRSAAYWILLSLFFTPLVSIVLLACLGENEKKRKEKKEPLLKNE